MNHPLTDPLAGAALLGARREQVVRPALGRFDPRKLLARIRRRLQLIGAIGCAVFVATLIVTLSATPMYTATSKVMLDVRKEQVTDMTAVLSGLPSESSVVDSEVQVLDSRELTARVVEALKLENDPEFNPNLPQPRENVGIVGAVTSRLLGPPARTPPPSLSDAEVRMGREAAVEQVWSRLQVSRSGLTYLIEISFTSKYPAKAARIANAYAEQYMLAQIDAKSRANQQANAWLGSRLEELAGEVQEADAAVELYKIRNNLFSSADGASITEQEISNYNQQLAQARTQQAEADARLSTAQNQLARASNGEDIGEALNSHVIQQLQTQRAGLAAKVAGLSGRYGDRHPEMLKATRELAEVNNQIQAEVQRIITNLESQASVARQRTGSIAGSLYGAKGTLANNNRASVQLRELERNADSKRAVYENMLNRYRQVSAEPGTEQPDARIVSRAGVPAGPSSPNLPLSLAIGLMLAGASSGAAFMAAEAFDSTFLTSEDITSRVDMACVGSIPDLRTIGGGRSSPIEYVLENPRSALAESFRHVLAFLALQPGSKVIAVTSALPEEGKTTAAVALARVAAGSGFKSIVVDCDVRRPDVGRMLGLTPAAGLIEMLAGEAAFSEVVVRDEKSGADVLPIARDHLEGRDLINSELMSAVLGKLRRDYDLVLLATPPVLAVADTKILTAKADTVLFLVRWGKTPQKAVENALRLLGDDAIDKTHAVLTQVDSRKQAKFGYGDPAYYYEQYKSYYLR